MSKDSSELKNEILIKGNLPAHVAIIMDGNGRWAKRRGLPRAAGHRAAAESVRAVVEACRELGVKVLTLYAFSTENWRRPKREIRSLWSLLKRYVGQELDNIHKEGIRCRAIGRLNELPMPRGR